nr:helix-turn-helix domain-containing protein [Mycobacterium avium]
MAPVEFLTAAQVSELTGLPQATLRYWRHANQGPASFRLGRRIMYRREVVERWIAAQEKATTRGGVDAH